MASADQIIHPVEVSDIESRLPSLARESVEELYSFGALMVSSAQQRAIRLDTKLTGILNWSSAMLAFVLIDASVSHQHGGSLAVSALAMIAAIASVACSYVGLKSKVWPAPSERDWFQERLLDKPDMLRRYHVVSMLNVHQSQSHGNSHRAATLRWAELCLALSAITTFLMLFIRLV
jgi:hypothetical protein